MHVTGAVNRTHPPGANNILDQIAVAQYGTGKQRFLNLLKGLIFLWISLSFQSLTPDNNILLFRQQVNYKFICKGLQPFLTCVFYINEECATGGIPRMGIAPADNPRHKSPHCDHLPR